LGGPFLMMFNDVYHIRIDGGNQIILCRAFSMFL